VGLGTVLRKKMSNEEISLSVYNSPVVGRSQNAGPPLSR